MHKIFLVCPKFSPGMLSHITALYLGVEKLNHHPVLVLEAGFKQMENEIPSNFEVYFFNGLMNFKKIYNTIRPKCTFIYSPSAINPILARWCKNTCYVYHEPWGGLKEIAGLEMLRKIKVLLLRIFQVLTVKSANIIAVPSKRALEMYSRHDVVHNSNVCILPLIMSEEEKQQSGTHICDRDYFSFIGSAIKEHNFNGYLNFIKWAYYCKSHLKFMICTKSILGDLQSDPILNEMIATEKLIINQKKFLSNTEINLAYQRSIAVWNLYKRSTQSGVLVKSLMFGTPVVASNVGAFGEDIRDGYNGYLLPLSEINNHELIHSRIDNIINNLEEMSLNASTSFHEKSNYKANLNRINDIIVRLKRN